MLHGIEVITRMSVAIKGPLESINYNPGDTLRSLQLYNIL